MGRLSPLSNSLTLGLVLLFLTLFMPNNAAPVSESASRYANEKGCYFMNKHYDTGHEIETNDPCMNCTCSGAAMMCYLRICPFIQPIGENCHMSKHVGDCCPRYWCPEVYPRVTSPRPESEAKGCYLNGLHYEEGSRLPVDPLNPCHACYCIRNVSVCTNETCELHIPGCYPRYKLGSCCPASYVCTEEAATTIPPTVFDSAIPPGCNVSGVLYDDGAEVPSNESCKKCYCMRHQVMCTAMECTVPGTNCVPHEVPDGQCCPEKYDCPEDTEITAFSTTHMISTEEEFHNLTTTRMLSSTVSTISELVEDKTYNTLEAETLYPTTKGVRKIDDDGVITMVPTTEVSVTQGLSIETDLISRPRVPKITDVPEDMFTTGFVPRVTTGKPLFYPSRPIPGEGICRFENKTYQNKEEVTSSDPCRVNCTCVNSVVLCERVECVLEPPESGVNCKVKKLPDECCPKYVCDMISSTSPSNISETPEQQLIVDAFTKDIHEKDTATSISSVIAETDLDVTTILPKSTTKTDIAKETTSGEDTTKEFETSVTIGSSGQEIQTAISSEEEDRFATGTRQETETRKTTLDTTILSSVSDAETSTVTKKDESKMTTISLETESITSKKEAEQTTVSLEDGKFTTASTIEPEKITTQQQTLVEQKITHTEESNQTAIMLEVQTTASTISEEEKEGSTGSLMPTLEGKTETTFDLKEESKIGIDTATATLTADEKEVTTMPLEKDEDDKKIVTKTISDEQISTTQFSTAAQGTELTVTPREELKKTSSTQSEATVTPLNVTETVGDSIDTVESTDRIKDTAIKNESVTTEISFKEKLDDRTTQKEESRITTQRFEAETDVSTLTEDESKLTSKEDGMKKSTIMMEEITTTPVSDAEEKLHISIAQDIKTSTITTGNIFPLSTKSKDTDKVTTMPEEIGEPKDITLSTFKTESVPTQLPTQEVSFDSEEINQTASTISKSEAVTSISIASDKEEKITVALDDDRIKIDTETSQEPSRTTTQLSIKETEKTLSETEKTIFTTVTSEAETVFSSTTTELKEMTASTSISDDTDIQTDTKTTGKLEIISEGLTTPEKTKEVSLTSEKVGETTTSVTAETKEIETTTSISKEIDKITMTTKTDEIVSTSFTTEGKIIAEDIRTTEDVEKITSISGSAESATLSTSVTDEKLTTEQDAVFTKVQDKTTSEPSSISFKTTVKEAEDFTSMSSLEETEKTTPVLKEHATDFEKFTTVSEITSKEDHFETDAEEDNEREKISRTTITPITDTISVSKVQESETKSTPQPDAETITPQTTVTMTDITVKIISTTHEAAQEEETSSVTKGVTQTIQVTSEKESSAKDSSTSGFATSSMSIAPLETEITTKSHFETSSLVPEATSSITTSVETEKDGMFVSIKTDPSEIVQIKDRTVTKRTEFSSVGTTSHTAVPETTDLDEGREKLTTVPEAAILTTEFEWSSPSFTTVTSTALPIRSTEDMFEKTELQTKLITAHTDSKTTFKAELFDDEKTSQAVTSEMFTSEVHPFSTETSSESETDKFSIESSVKPEIDITIPTSEDALAKTKVEQTTSSEQMVSTQSLTTVKSLTVSIGDNETEAVTTSDSLHESTPRVEDTSDTLLITSVKPDTATEESTGLLPGEKPEDKITESEMASSIITESSKTISSDVTKSVITEESMTDTTDLQRVTSFILLEKETKLTTLLDEKITQTPEMLHKTTFQAIGDKPSTISHALSNITESETQTQTDATQFVDVTISPLMFMTTAKDTPLAEGEITISEILTEKTPAFPTLKSEKTEITRQTETSTLTSFTSRITESPEEVQTFKTEQAVSEHISTEIEGTTSAVLNVTSTERDFDEGITASKQHDHIFTTLETEIVTDNLFTAKTHIPDSLVKDQTTFFEGKTKATSGTSPSGMFEATATKIFADTTETNFITKEAETITIPTTKFSEITDFHTSTFGTTLSKTPSTDAATAFTTQESISTTSKFSASVEMVTTESIAINASESVTVGMSTKPPAADDFEKEKTEMTTLELLSEMDTTSVKGIKDFTTFTTKLEGFSTLEVTEPFLVVNQTKLSTDVGIVTDAAFSSDETTVAEVGTDTTISEFITKEPSKTGTPQLIDAKTTDTKMETDIIKTSTDIPKEKFSPVDTEKQTSTFSISTEQESVTEESKLPSTISTEIMTESTTAKDTSKLSTQKEETGDTFTSTVASSADEKLTQLFEAKTSTLKQITEDAAETEKHSTEKTLLTTKEFQTEETVTSQSKLFTTETTLTEERKIVSPTTQTSVEISEQTESAEEMETATFIEDQTISKSTITEPSILSSKISETTPVHIEETSENFTSTTTLASDVTSTISFEAETATKKEQLPEISDTEEPHTDQSMFSTKEPQTAEPTDAEKITLPMSKSPITDRLQTSTQEQTIETSSAVSEGKIKPVDSKEETTISSISTETEAETVESKVTIDMHDQMTSKSTTVAQSSVPITETIEITSAPSEETSEASTLTTIRQSDLTPTILFEVETKQSLVTTKEPQTTETQTSQSKLSTSTDTITVKQSTDIPKERISPVDIEKKTTAFAHSTEHEDLAEDSKTTAFIDQTMLKLTTVAGPSIISTKISETTSVRREETSEPFTSAVTSQSDTVFTESETAVTKGQVDEVTETEQKHTVHSMMTTKVPQITEPTTLQTNTSDEEISVTERKEQTLPTSQTSLSDIIEASTRTESIKVSTDTLKEKTSSVEMEKGTTAFAVSTKQDAFSGESKATTIIEDQTMSALTTVVEPLILSTKITETTIAQSEKSSEAFTPTVTDLSQSTTEVSFETETKFTKERLPDVSNMEEQHTVQDRILTKEPQTTEPTTLQSITSDAETSVSERKEQTLPTSQTPISDSFEIGTDTESFKTSTDIPREKTSSIEEPKDTTSFTISSEQKTSTEGLKTTAVFEDQTKSTLTTFSKPSILSTKVTKTTAQSEETSEASTLTIFHKKDVTSTVSFEAETASTQGQFLEVSETEKPHTIQSLVSTEEPETGETEKIISRLSTEETSATELKDETMQTSRKPFPEDLETTTKISITETATEILEDKISSVKIEEETTSTSISTEDKTSAEPKTTTVVKDQTISPLTSVSGLLSPTTRKTETTSIQSEETSKDFTPAVTHQRDATSTVSLEAETVTLQTEIQKGTTPFEIFFEHKTSAGDLKTTAFIDDQTMSKLTTFPEPSVLSTKITETTFDQSEKTGETSTTAFTHGSDVTFTMSFEAESTSTQGQHQKASETERPKTEQSLISTKESLTTETVTLQSKSSAAETTTTELVQTESEQAKTEDLQDLTSPSSLKSTSDGLKPRTQTGFSTEVSREKISSFENDVETTASSISFEKETSTEESKTTVTEDEIISKLTTVTESSILTSKITETTSAQSEETSEVLTSAVTRQSDVTATVLFETETASTHGHFPEFLETKKPHTEESLISTKEPQTTETVTLQSKFSATETRVTEADKHTEVAESSTDLPKEKTSPFEVEKETTAFAVSTEHKTSDEEWKTTPFIKNQTMAELTTVTDISIPSTSIPDEDMPTVTPVVTSKTTDEIAMTTSSLRLPGKIDTITLPSSTVSTENLQTDEISSQTPGKETTKPKSFITEVTETTTPFIKVTEEKLDSEPQSTEDVKEEFTTFGVKEFTKTESLPKSTTSVVIEDNLTNIIEKNQEEVKDKPSTIDTEVSRATITDKIPEKTTVISEKEEVSTGVPELHTTIPSEIDAAEMHMRSTTKADATVTDHTIITERTVLSNVTFAADAMIKSQTSTIEPATSESTEITKVVDSIASTSQTMISIATSQIFDDSEERHGFPEITATPGVVSTFEIDGITAIEIDSVKEITKSTTDISRETEKLVTEEPVSERTSLKGFPSTTEAAEEFTIQNKTALDTESFESITVTEDTKSTTSEPFHKTTMEVGSFDSTIAARLTEEDDVAKTQSTTIMLKTTISIDTEKETSADTTSPVSSIVTETVTESSEKNITFDSVKTTKPIDFDDESDDSGLPEGFFSRRDEKIDDITTEKKTDAPSMISTSEISETSQKLQTEETKFTIEPTAMSFQTKDFTSVDSETTVLHSTVSQKISEIPAIGTTESDLPFMETVSKETERTRTTKFHEMKTTPFKLDDQSDTDSELITGFTDFEQTTLPSDLVFSSETDVEHSTKIISTTPQESSEKMETKKAFDIPITTKEPTEDRTEDTIRTVSEEDDMTEKTTCTLNNTSYKDGEAVTTIDPCEKCHCSLGEIRCFNILCKQPQNGCIPKANSTSECCPTSYECPEGEMKTTITTARPVFTDRDLTTPIPISFMFSTMPTSIASTILVTKPDENEVPVEASTKAPTHVDSVTSTSKDVETTASDSHPSTVVSKIATTEAKFDSGTSTSTDIDMTETSSLTSKKEADVSGQETSTPDELISGVTKQSTETPTTFDTIKTTFVDDIEKSSTVTTLLDTSQGLVKVSNLTTDFLTPTTEKIPTEETEVSSSMPEEEIVTERKSEVKSTKETAIELRDQLFSATKELEDQITTKLSTPFEENKTVTEMISKVTETEKMLLDKMTTPDISELSRETTTQEVKVDKSTTEVKDMTSEMFTTFLPSTLSKIDELHTTEEELKSTISGKNISEQELKEDTSTESLMTTFKVTETKALLNDTISSEETMTTKFSSSKITDIVEKESSTISMSGEEISTEILNETAEETHFITTQSPIAKEATKTVKPEFIVEEIGPSITKFDEIEDDIFTTSHPIQEESTTFEKDTTDFDSVTEVIKTNKTVPSFDTERTAVTQEKDAEFQTSPVTSQSSDEAISSTTEAIKITEKSETAAEELSTTLFVSSTAGETHFITTQSPTAKEATKTAVPELLGGEGMLSVTKFDEIEDDRLTMSHPIQEESTTFDKDTTDFDSVTEVIKTNKTVPSFDTEGTAVIQEKDAEFQTSPVTSQSSDEAISSTTEAIKITEKSETAAEELSTTLFASSTTGETHFITTQSPTAKEATKTVVLEILGDDMLSVTKFNETEDDIFTTSHPIQEESTTFDKDTTDFDSVTEVIKTNKTVPSFDTEGTAVTQEKDGEFQTSPFTSQSSDEAISSTTEAIKITEKSETAAEELFTTLFASSTTGEAHFITTQSPTAKEATKTVTPELSAEDMLSVTKFDEIEDDIFTTSHPIQEESTPLDKATTDFDIVTEVIKTNKTVPSFGRERTSATQEKDAEFQTSPVTSRSSDEASSSTTEAIKITEKSETADEELDTTLLASSKLPSLDFETVTDKKLTTKQTSELLTTIPVFSLKDKTEVVIHELSTKEIFSTTEKLKSDTFATEAMSLFSETSPSAFEETSDREITVKEMESEKPATFRDEKDVTFIPRKETETSTLSSKIPETSEDVTSVTKETEDESDIPKTSAPVTGAPDRIFTFVSTRFTDLMKGITEFTTVKSDAETTNATMKEFSTSSELTTKVEESVTPLMPLTSKIGLEFDMSTPSHVTEDSDATMPPTISEEEKSTSEIGFESINGTEASTIEKEKSPKDIFTTIADFMTSFKDVSMSSLSETEKSVTFSTETKGIDMSEELGSSEKDIESTKKLPVTEQSTQTEQSAISTEKEKHPITSEATTFGHKKISDIFEEKTVTESITFSPLLTRTIPSKAISETIISLDQETTLQTVEVSRKDVTVPKKETESIETTTVSLPSEILKTEKEMTAKTEPSVITSATEQAKDIEIASRGTRKDVELEITPTPFTRVQVNDQTLSTVESLDKISTDGTKISSEDVTSSFAATTVFEKPVTTATISDEQASVRSTDQFSTEILSKDTETTSTTLKEEHTEIITSNTMESSDVSVKGTSLTTQKPVERTEAIEESIANQTTIEMKISTGMDQSKITPGTTSETTTTQITDSKTVTVTSSSEGSTFTQEGIKTTKADIDVSSESTLQPRISTDITKNVTSIPMLDAVKTTKESILSTLAQETETSTQPFTDKSIQTRTTDHQLLSSETSTMISKEESSSTEHVTKGYKAIDTTTVKDEEDYIMDENTCIFEGRIFQSAEQIPRADPCEFCFCFRGDIICLQQSCPPPAVNCDKTSIPGYCCPRYECPVYMTSRNITALSKRKGGVTPIIIQRRIDKREIRPTVEVKGCQINGTFYEFGKTVTSTSGPCLHCVCQEDGLMHCDPQRCKPEAPLMLKMNNSFFRRR